MEMLVASPPPVHAVIGRFSHGNESERHPK
jgi:hypothetical protein